MTQYNCPYLVSASIGLPPSGPQSGSISITWEHVRNSESQVRPRTTESEPSFNKFCRQFMCTFSLRSPGVQLPQTRISFTGTAVLSRVLLTCPAHCVTRVLSPIVSRDGLSSETVSLWVLCLGPMPLCCGQPLCYDILLSINL